MIEIGDKVLVSANRLGLEDSPTALVERVVLGRDKRKVILDAASGATRPISTKVVRSQFGILGLRVGDLASEAGVLDPLLELVHRNLNLLIPDGDRSFFTGIRTQVEFEKVWTLRKALTTHVVLIGHGSANGLLFLDGVADDSRMAELMADPVEPPTVLSLACQTGRAGFGGKLSGRDHVGRVIAPFQTIHGSNAALFAHRYFSGLLLAGTVERTTIRQANMALPAGSHFRLFEDGLHLR